MVSFFDPDTTICEMFVRPIFLFRLSAWKLFFAFWWLFPSYCLFGSGTSYRVRWCLYFQLMRWFLYLVWLWYLLHFLGTAGYSSISVEITFIANKKLLVPVSSVSSVGSSIQWYQQVGCFSTLLIIRIIESVDRFAGPLVRAIVAAAIASWRARTSVVHHDGWRELEEMET